MIRLLLERSSDQVVLDKEKLIAGLGRQAACVVVLVVLFRLMLRFRLFYAKDWQYVPDNLDVTPSLVRCVPIRRLLLIVR